MRTIKSLRFNRNHSFDVNREDSFVSLNREIDGTFHNYYVQVHPSLKGDFNLSVYLSMTSPDSKNILVHTSKHTTRAEAERAACTVLNKLERSDLSEYIEEWKSCSISPVFDERYNYVGDAYASLQTIESNAKSFDYYNTNPVNKLYGKFYVLKDKNCCKEETVTLGTHTTKACDKPELIKKLLSKLDKNKYARFFE